MGAPSEELGSSPLWREGCGEESQRKLELEVMGLEMLSFPSKCKYHQMELRIPDTSQHLKFVSRIRRIKQRDSGGLKCYSVNLCNALQCQLNFQGLASGVNSAKTCVRDHGGLVVFLSNLKGHLTDFKIGAKNDIFEPPPLEAGQ